MEPFGMNTVNGSTTFIVNGVNPSTTLEPVQEDPHTPVPAAGPQQDEVESQETPKRQLLYRITESCPLYLGFIYGFQQLAESAAGLIGLVTLVQMSVCGDGDPIKFAELMNAMLLITGFSTIVEICLGIRLPVMEGVSYAYLAPVIAMRNLPAYRCLPPCSEVNATIAVGVTDQPPECEDDAYGNRLREVAGSLMCAGLVQFVLGATGGVGFLLNFVSSLTIAVTVMLLGIGFFESVANRASNYWPAALLTAAAYIIFGLVLSKVSLPMPAWDRKRKLHFKRIPVFRLFPSLLAICVGWFFCYIMTLSGELPDDPVKDSYKARTDSKAGVLERAEWFVIPYPGIIGWPTFGLGLFIGFLSSVVSSTFESIGDYVNIARACEEPPPPKHAVNRGIAVEGLLSVLSGSIGTCLGTTTYSDVAGLVPVTGMASRFGWLMVGIVYMLAGILGKVTAAVALVPDPVIAGFNIFSFGMIAAVGMSHLQNVDMKSVRNLVVLACSLMIGITVPYWSKNNIEDLDTGYKDANQVIQILLTSYMFVGGLTAFILDNIVSGSKKERGVLALMQHVSDANDSTYADRLDDVYGLPFVTKWMRRRRALSHVPFLPPYNDRLYI